MSHDLNPENHTASRSSYKQLESYARSMRREPTVAEIRLWECLRRQQLGVKFRRQHVIGDTIADFVCLDEMLVIEADGEYHFNPEQQTTDEQRTLYLQNLGYRVLRFSNDDIIYHIEDVLQAIKNKFIFTK